NPRVRLARRDIVMHSRRSNGGNHHWVNIQSAGWVNIQSAQTIWEAEAVRLGAKAPAPGKMSAATKGLAGWQGNPPGK
ncbi:hypothetical protein ACUHMQ_21190, partial [Chitinimonas sp. PSY-7]|uniref:hypothetical protein n=1 Tax=Chitinimonas sp. PSY-7 TaxID=3459088 RepID=UPI004040136A